MKNHFFYAFALAGTVTLGAMTGCGGNDNDDDNNPKEITVQNRDALNQTVYADEIAGKSLTFTTTGAWTATVTEKTPGKTGTPNWVTIDPKSGNKADTYTVTISFTANDTNADRMAAIKIASEGKEVTINITQKATTKDGKPYENPVDVYIVGWQFSSTGNFGQYDGISMLWKNGVRQNISVREGDEFYGDFTKPSSIFVSGNDVYVSGTLIRNSLINGNRALLWKNGEWKDLGLGSASSVYVLGGDVYVAGTGRNAQSGYVATLWKNGVAQYLTDETSDARSVFVSGNDVYVAGRRAGRTTIWKNGVAQNLTDGTYSAGAYSVFVSGNDVYVAGVEASGQEYQSYGSTYNYIVAKLWKNGIAQNLSDGRTHGADASSVFVSGKDVYVAGNNGSSAVIWKNGEPQTFGLRERVHSIFVLGNDVYAVGDNTTISSSTSAVTQVAVQWKNGVRQNLAGGGGGSRDGEALSVFVVKK